MISARPPRTLTHRLPAVHHSLHRRGLAQDGAKPQPPSDHRASAKLFEDAAREETGAVPARPSRLTILEQRDENWTGEESMQDAVLRMLVDKYKPLRGGPIRTADEKLKQAPPRVRVPEQLPLEDTSDANADSVRVGDADEVVLERVEVKRKVWSAGEPLLPSIEGHEPWHTTFKAPSHATSSVRYGRMPAPSKSSVISQSLDERVRRKERDARKRTEQAGRLSRARESTLDYRLGIKNSGGTEQPRPNPTSMKGWASLVEDRIETARLEGLFKNVKGRGQPLASTTQERNPFIAREEFLMNRIVQRQGAAPPWVEIQGELETAIASFRGIVKQSWTRRALRTLTASQPAALLPHFTLEDMAALRDAEWEAREAAYHERALAEVNGLVRKYNGLAPYAVRRPYYMRAAELERAYREAGEDILQGFADRVNGTASTPRGAADSDEDEGKAGGASRGAGVDVLARLRLRDLLRDWWGALRWR